MMSRTYANPRAFKDALEARIDGLEWPDVSALFELCQAFLNPVLDASVDQCVWHADAGQWRLA